jgi:hypothetical protein
MTAQASSNFGGLALQLKAAETALKKARAMAVKMGKDEAAARMAHCLDVLAAKRAVSILRERVALDRFGKILMSRVRDEAIRDCDAITMKDGGPEKVPAGALVPKIVDTTLHRLLCMIGDEDMVALSVFAAGKEHPSLREASDDLPGECSAPQISRHMKSEC